jgi:hypothetical protein
MGGLFFYRNKTEAPIFQTAVLGCAIENEKGLRRAIGVGVQVCPRQMAIDSGRKIDGVKLNI